MTVIARLCPICRAALDADARACRVCGSAVAAAGATPSGDALTTGTKLLEGEYVIGQVLGQGGFGITYRATEVTRGRDVAIKEFFPAGCYRAPHQATVVGGDDFLEARQRFMDEAGRLARCLHPGIVRVLATFVENGTAYMAMELLEGPNLAQVLEARTVVPEAVAVRIAQQLGQALEVLHGAELLHRDIKPHNIVLTGEGGAERAVLIDFGAAREFRSGETRRMTAMITPGYAPLEQYGQQARYGVFTDIYGLAATLYHLLTGEAPVSATDRAAGVELPPPDRINPYTSHAASSAVMWGLRMKVAERPQSVHEFLTALAGGKIEAVVSPVPAPYVPPVNPASWLQRFGPKRKAVRWTEIRISARRIKWPARCVCCLEPAQTTLRVQVEVVREEIPYCNHCHGHAASMLRTRGLLSWLFAAVGIGYILFTWMTAYTPAHQNMVEIAIPVAVLFGLVTLPLFFNIWHLRKSLRRSCATAAPAVEYRGSQRGIDVFAFSNPQYAAEFRALNAAHCIEPGELAAPLVHRHGENA